VDVELNNRIKGLLRRGEVVIAVNVVANACHRNNGRGLPDRTLTDVLGRALEQRSTAFASCSDDPVMLATTVVRRGLDSRTKGQLYAKANLRGHHDCALALC